ncbi:MAG: O-antigen translocase, partial [Bacteroidota bacterium]
MTSLNGVVVVIRLIISVVVQRLLALTFGEAGIAKIGQLRNVMNILTSTSSAGIFNGIVKYTSEHENSPKRLGHLFSTGLLFILFGSILSTVVLFFNAEYIADRLFGGKTYVEVIRYLSFLPLVIGINRMLYGFINGFSDYKKFAKIELGSYLMAISLLLLGLYYFNLKGVLIAMVLAPIVNALAIAFFFVKRLKTKLKLNGIKIDTDFIKPMLAFSLMSFISTVLINYIEIDIRSTITNRIDIDEAGYWTAMTYISKNYMVFSSSLFTLYVIPKFAKIEASFAFVKEVLHIYKTLLPLFALGMLIIYLFREQIIHLVYPNFEGMSELFKWQLMGDFVRLATLVISHQFLAKKMVWSFVIAQLISLGLFYGLSKYYV